LTNVEARLVLVLVELQPPLKLRLRRLYTATGKVFGVQ